MKFDYSIVHRKETLLAGIFRKTTCENAQKDCIALWSTFKPFMETLSSSPYEGTPFSYGVSFMNGQNQLTYWAAIEVTEIKTLPHTLSPLTLPKGEYLLCTISNLELISTVFTDMYTNWQNNQKEFALDMELPCFEEYTPKYLSDGSVSIYAPIKKVH